LSSFDAFLFFTPEYNRSMPAVLKNALDVGSRPYGKSKWDGKPAGIISVSPGAIGAFGANHHLRQCLTFLNMHPLQQPEMYIGNVTQLLDDKGRINSEESIKLLIYCVREFVEWIEKVYYINSIVIVVFPKRREELSLNYSVPDLQAHYYVLRIDYKIRT